MFCDIILVGIIISGQARNGLHGLVISSSHCDVPLHACARPHTVGLLFPSCSLSLSSRWGKLRFLFLDPQQGEVGKSS